MSKKTAPEGKYDKVVADILGYGALLLLFIIAAACTFRLVRWIVGI